MPVGVGIIGCGNISAAYLKAAPLFPGIAVRAVADINGEAAAARGAEFNIPARPVEALLDDPDIEIIVNLTIPQAHVPVGLQVIAAGKHVHSEKPLAITTDDARRLLDAARDKGVRVGCAPDTFLGGAHQTCRKLLDDGAIGTPLGGTAFFMCPGHERWHPNPGFYYLEGGGPMLDMGPYYITDLVNLLGPIARVSGIGGRLRDRRTITSEPLNGTVIPVEVDTHVAGTLEFVSGAVVTIVMSFDVIAHRHRPIELYGTEASIAVPDPNHFGGEIEVARARDAWQVAATEHRYVDGDYRILGVADMAAAIRKGRPHRASGELAYHVLEVMEAFRISSNEGRHVQIASSPERPAPLPVGLEQGVLD